MFLAERSAVTGGALCSTPSFCLARAVESRKLAFWRQNGVFFGFWGHFEAFLAILGRKTGTFTQFLA
jgi:hypothetical protein